MRLSLPERKIELNEGFANDLFGYRPFGERLANVVRGIDQPLVITLDGPWGSGKSTFIKQWAGLLRQQGAAVIEFDAFGNDHHEDAFLALSAEIYALAADTLGASTRVTKDYFKKAKATAKVLLPIGARIATRAATAGLVSLEDVKGSGEAAKAALDAFGKEGEKWAEKFVSDQLRGAAKERAALQSFRDTLTSLAKELAKRQAASVHVDTDTATAESAEADNDSTYPLIVIIDELDRCRPPFALSLIERIKHLFLVDDVCFVLVTHLPQLESAVQGAYGSTFDAREYLEKFYHLRAILPQGRRETGDAKDIYVRYLWRTLGITIRDGEQNRLATDLVIEFARVHDLSLRSIERLMSLLVLVSAAVGRSRLFVAPLVVGLCLLRQRAPHLYARAIAGNLKNEEVADFFFGSDSPSPEKVRLAEWSLNWWSYATGEEVDQDSLRHIENTLFHYNADSTRLLPLLAGYIDSFEVRA